MIFYRPIVEWTTITEANIVKSNRELHRHLFQATRQIFINYKNKKNKANLSVQKMNPEKVYEIACIIYNRCIKNIDNYKDFDSLSAVDSAECFQIILGCINPYEVNKESFGKFSSATYDL